MSNVPSILNPPGQGVRQSGRQTRTNPSRVSKNTGRSSFGFGQASMAEIPATIPDHGFYPAITHFTDAITALPREFRRHNSLLKEVDAKAWALEENLLQLLQLASESQPALQPSNPVSTVGSVEPPSSESPESKNRRILFNRVRQSLSDLMMTADEKNHVIFNANDELDRQMMRLDNVFPYIAGEISEEARLGSLSHWAYSNKNTAKAAANERPRREAVSQRQDLSHVLHEAEAASRSEARREAVSRRQRRQVDADYEDSRSARKATAGKARGENTADASTAPKRRKVERPQVMDAATPMERSASGTGSQRAHPKETAEKKRARAPNTNATSRKKVNINSNAGSPVLAPSPLIGPFNAPRSAASPGPNAARAPSSRAQQAAGPRQRPSSSTSNRVNHTNSSKPSDPRSTPRDGSIKHETGTAEHRDFDSETGGRASVPAGGKREDMDRSADSLEAETSKGRSSKTATPVMSSMVELNQSRSRPTRSADTAPAKRTTKKTAVPVPAVQSDEESFHEGDDEDEEGEPRYCYCNQVSFGEMVACDNLACPREWFHLSCVGLIKPPGKNVKWYCNECKETLRRGRNGR